MVTYTCQSCHKTFDKKYVYERHMVRKTPCAPKNAPPTPKQHQCSTCQKNFTRSDNLARHMRTCTVETKVKATTVPTEMNEAFINQLKTIIRNELQEEFKRTGTPVASQPTTASAISGNSDKQPTIINNNILNVICVRNNDNYLDMLTDQWGNFDQALDYVKDCALSSVSGDCKLLTKVYFNDREHKNVTYIDENSQAIAEDKTLRLGRRLANNLQNTYLKGINYLINTHLDSHISPQKFLDEHDLQNWNKHIFDLSNIQYCRKIMSQMKM